MPSKRERQVRKRRNQARRTAGVVRKRLARLNKAIRVFNRRLRNLSASPGERAIDAALTMVGKTETGHNDAPWLRQIENDLPHDRLDWMIPGQPYCGLGCIWAWWEGAGELLPDGTVYTPNICAGAPGPYGRKVAASQARPGDLVVFHFGSGGAKHVGLARGPARGGVISTVEFNTSPGSSGSQANGGGVFKRSRSLGLVLCVVRP